MKTILLVLISALSIASTSGQGRLNISPVPVTNGLTGTLADSNFLAGLYYGPAGTTEDSLQLSTATPLVNGFAAFGSSTIVPAFPSGAPVIFQVRAWSGNYPSYETAINSGLQSALAGKSAILTVTLGGSPVPPPIPNPLSFSGFTIWPVPEPTVLTFFLAGMIILRGVQKSASSGVPKMKNSGSQPPDSRS